MKNNKKLRIYYLLGKTAKLEPTAGDTINEFNNIKAILPYYDVYYNGVKCSISDKVFGRSDKVIHVPKEGEFDLVYVRNNKEVFLQSPSPKLWFASPYDEECFAQADGIVCMTKSWKNRLKTYSERDYDYFVQTYPMDMKPPKNLLLFPQSIEPPKNISLKETRPFGEDGRFSFKHFGPIRQSNYPYQLFSLNRRNPELYKKLEIECYNAQIKPFKKKKLFGSRLLARVAGFYFNRTRISAPRSVQMKPRVTRDEVDAILRRTDAVWYNLGPSGNVAGSLKILEAMAYGIPIILPRWDARVDELGPDYPLFWDLKPNSKIESKKQPYFDSVLERFVNMDSKERLKLKRYLLKRAQKFTPSVVGQIIHEEIEKFMIGDKK